MVKGSRFVYLAAAWLFVLGVTVQVFLAGMVVVASSMTWENHISLGHFLAAPLLIMLVSMYLGRMPGSLKRLTWLLFGVYVLQADIVIFLRSEAPFVSALHPVLALVDFALGWALARKAWALTREYSVQPAPQPDLGQSTPQT
jgi:hypothetical protein